MDRLLKIRQHIGSPIRAVTTEMRTAGWVYLEEFETSQFVFENPSTGERVILKTKRSRCGGGLSVTGVEQHPAKQHRESDVQRRYEKYHVR